MEKPGTLVIVGTPIGNLGDLSPRAADELARADAIACEDTRRTGRLLSLSGIKGPRLLVTNEHTERDRIGDVLDRLHRGQRVALVSDAGMPTIADPGRHLIDAVAAAGYRVDVVPGPVAAIAALSASGFAADRFVFEGFVPRKGAARADRLSAVALEQRTVVLYEAPQRVQRTITDLISHCGPDRAAVLAREITKLHEEVVRGSLGQLAEHLERHGAKGEFVIVVEGAKHERQSVDDAWLEEALQAAVDRGLSRRDAVIEVVAASGEPKRRVYDLANQLGSTAIADPSEDG